MGSSVTLNTYKSWQNIKIETAGFGLEDGVTAAGLRFTYTCDSLLLDNMYNISSKPPLSLDGLEIIENSDTVEATDQSAFESGYVFELLDEVDGRDNVVHMVSDPANSGGLISTSNYQGAKLTLSMDNTYTGEGVDYLGLYMKNTNIYCDQLKLEVLNSAGTSLGSVLKRMATTNDWVYYRVDLAAMGLTEESLDKIAAVRIFVNWNNQTTTATNPKLGEVYLDNVSFGSYVADSEDLFDHIASVQNVEWWWSGNNYYDNAGWLMNQNEDGGYFEIYRVKDKTTTDTGYSPRRQYLYFDAPITLTEDMAVSITANNTYMGTGTKISLLGDDGKKYGYLELNQTGLHTYKKSITDFVLLNADTHMTKTATPIDISSVKIVGAIFHNDFFNGDTTQDGSLVMDNFTIKAPTSLAGLDFIANAESVTHNNLSAFESGYVFEVLGEVDGRDKVVHMVADPATNGSLLSTSNTYQGFTATLSTGNTYSGAGVDYVGLYMKNTNIYCDNLYIEVLDGAGTKIGSVYKRMATTNDWSYYRIDVASLGIAQEKLANIAAVRVSVNWSNQKTDAANPKLGEVYIDNISFGSYVDDSSDLFDHIASLQNVEWWWSGNNYYDNAGWLMNQNEDGGYFEIYRVKDKTSSSTGYSPRRQYLYFDAPISLSETQIISITANNNYMGTGTKISLIGDDGNKYGYLELNQTGLHTYQVSVGEIVLLNADTHTVS